MSVLHGSFLASPRAQREPTSRAESRCCVQSKRFFALPEIQKNEIQRPPDCSLNRGYVGVGCEKVRERICVKESFDMGNPDDGEDQPNLWPSEASLPGFRAFMESFFRQCEVLVRHLLDALSLALKIPPECW